MKFKKVILIPASVMCLAALSSCGQNNNSFFAELKNGFESVEYEKYFSLPSNLFTIEKGYGQYVMQTAAVNSKARMRSTRATNFEVGTAPFFANMPMFTPGTKDIKFVPSANNNVAGNVKKDSYYNVVISPFTSSASKREAETTVKYYGSKDTEPVLHEIETSVRSDYDSYTQTTIKSQATNDEFIEYVGDIPETTPPEKGLFMLYRGHGSSDVLKSNDPSAGIVYKKPIIIEEGADPKEVLDKDARKTLNTQIYNISSIFENGEAECASFKSLAEVGKDNDFIATTTQGGTTASDFTFLSDGNGNIYEYSYIASPDVDVPVYDYAPYEQTVKGFEVLEAVAKLKYDNNVGWLYDNMTTAAKVYVKADAKLKPYATPKCLCSEYRHLEINYSDLGEFGNIEDAELYQDAPDLLVNLSIHNLDDTVPATVGSKVLVCDPNEDENMYINGGIYDHTFSARKAGLIKNNQYVFYGEANLGTQTFETKPTSPDQLIEEYTSSHYYVQTTLVSRDESTTIKVEPYTDHETKGSTIDAKLSEMISVYEPETAISPIAIEVNHESRGLDPEATWIGGTVVNFYILLEKENDIYHVEEFTITPVAKNASPATPAHDIGVL